MGPPEKDWKTLDGCKLPLGKPMPTKSKVKFKKFHF
jgi:hypothetical protein